MAKGKRKREIDGEIDKRTQRWDGADGVRLATTQELIDYDALREEKKENRELDGQKMLKAVVIWAARELNIPKPEARDEILAIYRNL